MKYGILASIALAAGLMLSACETMSAEECAVADWRALGFNDAATSGADKFSDRAESCMEKGFAADSASYAAGFGEGLYRFCQPPNGFQFARRGGTFSGVCPAELQYEFAGAYNDGRRVYEAESALASVRGNVSSLETRLDEIEHDMRSRERDIADPNKSSEERDWLRSDLERLRGERRDTIDDLRRAESNIYYAERRVQDLRFEIGSRWAPW